MQKWGIMDNQFFAMTSRMKYINRWALMRNSYKENISEHSLEVSILAHALAVIGNRRLGAANDTEKVTLIALYHDATEIMTGDMPTPVKYLNRDIKEIYKDIENQAAEKLLRMLPEDLQEEYRSVFFMQPGDEHLWRIVKAADKLSALIKCIEEKKAGNQEFEHARVSLEKNLVQMQLPELDIFMRDFLPAYYMSLDEMQS